MDKLPQEIVDLVASRLPEPGYRRSRPPWIPSPSVRPSIATVSNKFRHAIERLTFRELRVATSEIDTLDNIFSRVCVYRRSFLKDLHVVIVLPAHDDADWGKFEFDADRKVNNDAATKGMNRLLHTLSGWHSAISLAISLEMESLANIGPLTSEESSQRRHDIFRGVRCEDQERYAYSFIEVSDVDRMPLVPAVREIQFPKGEDHRQFSPKTTLALTAKFSQLHGIGMQWYEPYAFVEFLQTIRRQLTESLRTTHFPSTLAKLDFQLDPPLRTAGDISTSPNPQPDRLCQALHHAVNHILHLEFTSQVDPSLFWPYQPSETPKPFWQSMKTMEIVMDKDSTSSEWYLSHRYDMWSYDTIERFGLHSPTASTLPPPGHGSTDEARLAYMDIKRMHWHENEVWGLTEHLIDMGQLEIDDEHDDENDEEKIYNEEEDKKNKESVKDRMLEFCEVNESAMARLLEAMMKAMLQMPRLEFLSLGGFMSQAWAFEFYAPGIRSKHDSNSESESPPSYPRFILPEYFWVPGKDILDGFRNMAREKYGQEPVIVWVDRRRLGH